MLHLLIVIKQHLIISLVQSMVTINQLVNNFGFHLKTMKIIEMQPILTAKAIITYMIQLIIVHFMLTSLTSMIQKNIFSMSLRIQSEQHRLI
jgi:hypothetical protein